MPINWRMDKQNVVYLYNGMLLSFSHKVVCDFLLPHGLQHARLPCLPLAPGVCSNSCLLSWWYYLTILSSTPYPPSPFPFNLFQHFHHQGLFQRVSSSHQVAKLLELQLQHQSFQWIFGADFLLDWLIWSPCSPGTLKSLLQRHNLKDLVLQCLVFFMIQFSHPYMTTGNTIALTRWTFVSKMMPVFY